MLRVLVAEDEFLLREAVVAVLSAAEGIDVVDAVPHLSALETAFAVHRPEVVVTDIRMPPTGTDEGIRFARAHPQLPVVVLSQHDDPQYALLLLEHGAARRGYLLKERVGHPDQLVGAVRAVAAGGSSIDPRVVERLVQGRSRVGAVADLTPREREVLEAMATGMNNAAIARGLHVTERAVLKHIGSIFDKLGLSEEATAHKRVGAVLRYLAATDRR